MHYKIGTRGSKLALVQAEFVRDCLQEHYPQDRFELKIIKTKGDKIQNKALSAIEEASEETTAETEEASETRAFL